MKEKMKFSAQNFSDLIELLENAIEELPSEEHYIREGFDQELDEYRCLARGGKEKLAEMCAIEQEKTGISSLKIKYNKVFGYFFEVPKSQSEALPEYFIRRQTLTNAERFITPELKEFEEKILSAQNKQVTRESELFQNVQESVLEHIPSLQRISKEVAFADMITSFATVAKRKNFTKPKITEFSSQIHIEKGRHPIVERSLDSDSKQFIANDFNMKTDTFHLITGPNMGGKSTFLRQNALIIFLAHIGSFVPAKTAHIPLVDRIFTRIGSGDSLSTGESTFLTEMQESSRILHHATEKSFVILDEVGRGTSTYDGLSLAWAITEFLHEKQVKTLFATHYHELITLVKELKNGKNFSVRIIEDEKKGIVFLHQVFEGGAEKSFGIEVARLAGLPKQVIEKAEDVLLMLENTEKSSLERGSQISMFEEMMEKQKEKKRAKPVQKESEIEKKLQTIDINSLTPLEALQVLSSLQKDSKI